MDIVSEDAGVVPVPPISSLQAANRAERMMRHRINGFFIEMSDCVDIIITEDIN